MRIIAGKHRGRVLKTLTGEQTRPMMDRMKESVFQIIGPYFNGGTVLDLFGGSGALSLEAISRGAEEVYISEHFKDALTIIEKNVALLKEESKVHIYPISYEKMLQEVRTKKFDLIFLDPPYRLDIINEIIEFLIKENMIKKNGLIICHYSKGKATFTNHLPIIRNQFYGQSEVTIFKNC